MQTLNLKYLPEVSQPLEVIPLKPFGAQIFGFNVERAITSFQVFALRKALADHKVLLLRDQELSPGKQIQLTRMFGSELLQAGPPLRRLPDYPEIFRIANREGEGNKNNGQYWHNEGHQLSDPNPVTVMHIVHATTDGATWVTDCCAAFESLLESTKEYLVRHRFLAPETGVCHPIIRKHPLTGRMGLYVNLRGRAVDRYSSPVYQVAELVDAHLNRPGTFYEHYWRQGDTLIIDNFATAIRGTSSNPANLRVMHRTDIAGSSVWWRQQEQE